MINKKTERTYENVVYVIFISFFSYLLNIAFNTKSFKVNGMQSMTFPKGIISILIVLCATKFIMNIIEIIKDRDSKERFEKLHPIKTLTLALIIIYASLWNIIGFGLSSFIFVSTESKLLKKECSWAMALLIGFSSTALLYISFGFFFNVDFPEPILNLLF